MWSICIHKSINRRFLSLSVSLILILVADDTRFRGILAARAPSPVEVNKCCRIGETLDRNKQCTINSGETSDHWWPPIYLIGKQSYFPKQGEAPRFLRAHENRQPDCESPELFLNSFALFSNGSLFLGERSLFIDIEHFCIDKDVAFVCLKTSKKLKIRKCCSLNSIYQTIDQTCAPHSNGITQKLFETKNTTYIDLVYGFPRCSSATNNKYVIVDQFHENNLNIDDGTYILENTKKLLKNDEFCIDHTNQNANLVTGNVFACDELVAIKETPELNNEEVCQYNITPILMKFFFLHWITNK